MLDLEFEKDTTDKTIKNLDTSWDTEEIERIIIQYMNINRLKYKFIDISVIISHFLLFNIMFNISYFFYKDIFIGYFFAGLITGGFFAIKNKVVANAYSKIYNSIFPESAYNIDKIESIIDFSLERQIETQFQNSVEESSLLKDFIRSNKLLNQSKSNKIQSFLIDIDNIEDKNYLNESNEFQHFNSYVLYDNYHINNYSSLFGKFFMTKKIEKSFKKAVKKIQKKNIDIDY